MIAMKISYVTNTLKILCQLFPFYHVLIDSWQLVIINENMGVDASEEIYLIR